MCRGSRRAQASSASLLHGLRISECSVSEQLTCQGVRVLVIVRGNSRGDAGCDHSYWGNQQRVEAIGSWRRGNYRNNSSHLTDSLSRSMHLISIGDEVALKGGLLKKATHVAGCHFKFIGWPSSYALCYLLEIRNHGLRGLFLSVGGFVS